MTRLFLSLDDAVIVAHAQWGIDPELARNEFKQKCYITDDQYKIGYDDGLIDAIKAIETLDRRES